MKALTQYDVVELVTDTLRDGVLIPSDAFGTMVDVMDTPHRVCIAEFDQELFAEGFLPTLRDGEIKLMSKVR